ncbi:MAG TPA: two-component regulator propeller domain-containing protein, partial [Bacteroidales bacterium]|nr:two-component regulator propeller domain-containing protein [Bacteroidales bacterium]
NREYLYPNGPASDRSFRIVTNKRKTYVTAGGFNATLSNNYTKPCYYEFSDFDGWSDICLGSDTARDITNVIVDPANPDHLFAATWGYGLFEFRNNQPVAHYNSENSPMQSVLEGDYIRLLGMAYDKNNNLWLTSSGVENNILVKKNDGEWKSFKYGRLTGNSNITQLLITSRGDKWAVLPRGGGLLAFNNNETIDNESDDKKKVFSITDGEGVTITNQVYCLAEDRDGNIWVGTDDGPVVYYNPQSVFDGGIFEASKILVPKNDTSIYGEYLLKNQVVSAIKVDGANRKWIGTQGVGLFLMSPDGKKELARFTTDNSPLISNNILDISIDDQSGEVFIATDKGVVSYRGTATQGNEEFTNVYVFPNPVRENYEGDITITGLISDANVKITDISGNLVYETTSLGGQAIWNGRNFNGKRVKTGVYLVFCSNDDGTKTFVTKLLFIN